MIDLSKVKLPDCIEATGSFFIIKTDFRVWLNFSRIINTKGAVVDDVDFIYKDAIPSVENKKEAFEKLLEFFQPKNVLPRPVGEITGERILDYDLDADLIYAAFFEQYKIDLLATDKNGHLIEMHWHKFLALLSGLHDTKLNEIMGYRCYNPNDKTDYEKQMMQLRNMWELPTEESEKIKEDLEKFNSLFEN